MVKLQTRLDVEATAVTKGEADKPAAVARLVQLIPPARVDLVNEVMARIGRRKADRKDWPPFWLVCELASKVKRVQAGEVRLRASPARWSTSSPIWTSCCRPGRCTGSPGTASSSASTRARRSCEVVDLATLVEDEPGQSASPPGE